jgi:hypothetical protein
MTIIDIIAAVLFSSAIATLFLYPWFDEEKTLPEFID